MEHLISVLMPAYNAAGTIGPTIKSILGQTYQNFELIIVDDGSRDNTAEIAASFKDPRIVLLRNRQNLKLAKSLNIAIEAAKGKYLARSDADDINMPTRFQTQVSFLESNPDIDVVGTNAYIFDRQGDIVGQFTRQKSSHKDLTKNINRKIPLFHATIMARAEWLRRYKYREQYFRTEDRDLFFRAWQDSRFAHLPELLYAIRDPGRIGPEKILYSNWQGVLMRWRHWREYGLPAQAVLSYPLIVAGRFLYYSLSAALGRSWTWGHLQPVDHNAGFRSDQEWLRQCLREA